MILSIGTGTDSRIYVTSDGGRSWTLTFQNEDPNAFYDCMTFFDRQHGLALSDPVDGRFRILATDDGGRSWRVVDGRHAAGAGRRVRLRRERPVPRLGRRRHAWFATGGGAEARVFRSDDRGETWEVSATPIRSGPSAGIFALAFRDARHGLAVGGDFAAPDRGAGRARADRDGGRDLAARRRRAERVPLRRAPGSPARTRSSVGPTGSDVSFDRGRSWQRFDDGSFDTVDCADRGACWASGEQGRVAYLVRR